MRRFHMLSTHSAPVDSRQGIAKENGGNVRSKPKETGAIGQKDWKKQKPPLNKFEQTFNVDSVIRSTFCADGLDGKLVTG